MLQNMQPTDLDDNGADGMRLAEWLNDRNMSAAEFADKLGVHRSTVGRWLNDGAVGSGHRPSWEQLAKIKIITNGSVTANDFEAAPSVQPEDAA